VRAVVIQVSGAPGVPQRSGGGRKTSSFGRNRALGVLDLIAKEPAQVQPRSGP